MAGSRGCLRLRWCFLGSGGLLLLLFLLQVFERGEDIHRPGKATDNAFSVPKGCEGWSNDLCVNAHCSIDICVVFVSLCRERRKVLWDNDCLLMNNGM